MHPEMYVNLIVHGVLSPCKMYYVTPTLIDQAQTQNDLWSSKNMFLNLLLFLNIDMAHLVKSFIEKDKDYFIFNSQCHDADDLAVGGPEASAAIVLI